MQYQVKNAEHKLVALEVDESTDTTSKTQLLIFAHSIDEGVFVDFLCCKELPEATKGQDVFDVSHSYVKYCGVAGKIVAICTDSGPAMTGCLKEFVLIAHKQNPNIIHTN